ncbi:hypothetical protein JW824_06625 [bacterium]|nr:hypothetical protein [bacterium]RQV95542.1 MAG: hypothetical protein EH221_06115 [bacterium]
MDWIPVADNLHQIKGTGLESWLKEQKKRQALLESLLQNYNEGRSMSFFCKTCTRMPIDQINEAIKEAKEKLILENVDTSDKKAKALKSIIKNLAFHDNINLD